MADTDKQTDQEFEGFDTLDEAYADPADDTLADDMLDADFQDVEEPALDDVFEEDPQNEPAPKKKAKWFNIIVALVAVLGAGGLILMKLAPQLLNGGAVDTAAIATPAVIAADPQVTPETAAQEALAPMPAPGAQIEGGGMLDNPDAYAQLAQGAAPAPVAAPVEPDPFAAMNKAQPAQDVVAPVADVPMPAPITAEPVATPEIPAPAAEVMPVAAPATPEPAPVVAAAADTGAVSALQGQVTTLSSRMDSIESKLNAALAGTQIQTAAAPVDDSRFDKIQNALERLESRLNDMASVRTERASAPVQVSDDYAEPVKTVKKAVKKATAKAKKAVDEWGGAYNPSGSAPAVAKAQPVAAPAASSNAAGWTLRGAQPGQAIIGQSGGDIRQISLGDSVPGIGQVTGIAPINGRWVVQGTQGRISQ